MKALLLFALLGLLVSCGGSGDTVLVARSTGEKQCEPETRESLADSRQRLINNGIDVIASECGADGQVRAAVCGNERGTYNAHRIHQNNTVDARDLDYLPVSEIELYQAAECPAGEF